MGHDDKVWLVVVAAMLMAGVVGISTKLVTDGVMVAYACNIV